MLHATLARRIYPSNVHWTFSVRLFRFSRVMDKTYKLRSLNAMQETIPSLTPRAHNKEKAGMGCRRNERRKCGIVSRVMDKTIKPGSLNTMQETIPSLTPRAHNKEKAGIVCRVMDKTIKKI